MSDLAKQLQEPFSYEDIEWRAQQTGVTADGKPWAMVLAYVTNRAIQTRLDDVFGPDGWGNEYKPGPTGGVICGITAKGVTKWDGSDTTDIEATKGGLSSSMKRAGSQWGIGRYLYKLDVCFAECTKERPRDRDGWNEVYIKKDNRNNKSPDAVKFYWRNPDLPELALPKK
jgi:hypothetical protein